MTTAVRTAALSNACTAATYEIVLTSTCNVALSPSCCPKFGAYSTLRMGNRM